MAERDDPGTTNSRHDEQQSAEYIADLADELAKMARRSRLDLLAYLLDIASLEARSVSASGKTRN